MKALLALSLTLSMSLSLVGGCGRAIGETLSVATGAKGIFTPIQPVAATKDQRPLGGYERIELVRFSDDFGGKVPPALWDHLPREFQEQLAKKKLPNRPQGKTLLLRGKILHYEDENLVGIVLGPLEEVVVRVELVDKATDKVLGVANCIGRTETSMNVGVAKKAEGLAKALASWIASRYPEPQ